MASGNSYLPKREADQVAWSQTFMDVVAANAALYGCTVAQMTAFGVLNDALQAAWLAASQTATRTRTTVADKDNALAAMRASAKNLVSITRARRA